MNGNSYFARLCESQVESNLGGVLTSNSRCTYLEDERVNVNTCAICKFLHAVAITANESRFVVDRVYNIDKRDYVVVVCTSAEDVISRVHISNYDKEKLFIPVLFGFQCSRFYVIQRNYTQAASIRRNGKAVSQFLATVNRSNKNITNSHIKVSDKRYYLDPRGFSMQKITPSSALMTHLIIDYINTHENKVSIIGSYFVDKKVIQNAIAQVENQGRITDHKPFLNAQLLI